jgi:hypothetical protein
VATQATTEYLRMISSDIWRCVALARTEVSEEQSLHLQGKEAKSSEFSYPDDGGDMFLRDVGSSY